MDQIQELISKNRYRVNEKTKFLSRCIDGRYQNNLKSKISNLISNLPALAFPGADIGELALIFASGNIYGFEVDGQKLLKSLIEIIGGESNFGLHSGHHGDPKIIASDCDHYKMIKSDPEAYKMDKRQIEFIDKVLVELRKKGAQEIILEGEHLEGAILMVKGSWGILPRYRVETDGGGVEAQVFVYHQSLVDERHRALASTLLRQKAVKLFGGCDENYLYQVISETAENHLMETARRLAKGLPIYKVEFEDDGSFDIKEIGIV